MERSGKHCKPLNHLRMETTIFKKPDLNLDGKNKDTNVVVTLNVLSNLRQPQHL